MDPDKIKDFIVRGARGVQKSHTGFPSYLDKKSWIEEVEVRLAEAEEEYIEKLYSEEANKHFKCKKKEEQKFEEEWHGK